MAQPLYAINSVNTVDRKTTLNLSNGLDYEIIERTSLSTAEAAKALFKNAGHRLLDISFWHRYARLQGLRFILSGPGADALKPVALKNDVIKILAVDGWERWLKITDIIYRAPDVNSEYILLQMQDRSEDAYDHFGNIDTIDIILSREENVVSISLDGSITFPKGFSSTHLLKGLLAQND